jgi:hypothetical protein
MEPKIIVGIILSEVNVGQNLWKSSKCWGLVPSERAVLVVTPQGWQVPDLDEA